MPRAFTHTWFFFGDSLTLGVNDNRMPGGWVSRLVLLGQEAGLYRFPPATFYNLGARRQSTADLARRWRQEVDCRQMPGMVPHLVFCAGVVDMAAPGGGLMTRVGASGAASVNMVRRQYMALSKATG